MGLSEMPLDVSRIWMSTRRVASEGDGGELQRNLPHYLPFFLIIREQKGKVMILVLREGLCAVNLLLLNRSPKKQAQMYHLFSF